MRAWTVTDLVFDPITHTTRLPDGTDVPHVTHVLQSVGVSTDFVALAGQGPRVESRLSYARDRGTAVHADCHAYDDDDLVWATVDVVVRPYVEAWARVRDTHRLEPLRRERRVYHPTYEYAGILDGIFYSHQTGHRVLIDIKTGNPEDAAAHLQTAAYAEADQHTYGEQIEERWAVWLRPDKLVPYTIFNYSSRPDAYLDFNKWLACLTVFREQPIRRRKIR